MKLKIITEITKRAREMGILFVEEVSLRFDLLNVEKICGLRFEDLLNADDQNFTHDIVGIQVNFNRETYELDNHFLPRFASNESEAV